MSFKDLKKARGVSSLSKINEELDKFNKGSGNREDDNRFWKPKTDKAGNGAALIRFLPAPEGEDLPFVRLFSHAFQGPGGWYIENSLTTLGQNDPVSEYNRDLWNTEIKANQEIVRKQKRKLSFIANILVLKDPANPENDGKVFLFKFGKKIFDKLNDLMHPQEDALDKKEPVNPFCPWEGANFRLKVRKVDGYPNYDQSSFDAPSPLFDGDDQEIEALWKKEYPLKELVAPDKFKSYDELKKRLHRVLGLSARKSIDASQKSAGVTSTVKGTSQFVAAPATVEDEQEETEEISSESTSDDDLDYLSQLAEGDD